MYMRPLCKTCKQKPAAINYKKQNKTYYRSMCESCARHGGRAVGVPKWQQFGYKKKCKCEKCGYTSKHEVQFDVYHIDGDLNNCRPANLKTICANCQRIIQDEGARWRQGDLVPDL